MLTWADVSGYKPCEEFVLEIGRRNGWRMGAAVPRRRHLRRTGQPDAVRTLPGPGDAAPRKTAGRLGDRLPGADQDAHQGQNGSNRWSWCDALFMAPPVYALLANVTGDNGYREFMNREFYASSRCLFDAAEGLYYRDARYFGKREKNGEKVFWGRGNGWCYAALAILLDTLPESDPTYDYYRRMFLRMSETVVACQDARGSWHPSMLDHETYPMPENSASGFFTYGLAWGVNRGLLTAPVYKRAAPRAEGPLFACRPGRTPRIRAAHRRIAPADEPRNDRGVRRRSLPDGRLGDRADVTPYNATLGQKRIHS